MKIAHALMALILTVFFTGLIAGLATANVPGVALNAPPPPPAPNVATMGSSITIKVVTTHRDTGSPALHYVDRVALYDGNKLLKEWKYDQNNYKKDEVWTESYTGTANSDMRLRAVAHCTVHGYELAGVRVRVLPAGTKPSAMMQTDANYAGMQAFGVADVSKASDFLSSADSQFLQGMVRDQSGELKSFQGKMTGWMKSAEGQQFISQWDQKASTTTRMSLAVYAGSSDIPRISVIPTPIPRPITRGNMTVSPKASLKPSPTVKRLLARPAAAATASPTPVPGGYTPRFPGEPGYGKTSPTPTPAPVVSTSPAAQVTIPKPAPGGTAGMNAGAPSLTDQSRYAARGPGLVGGVKVPGPASAPGPMASPSPRPIIR